MPSPPMTEVHDVDQPPPARFIVPDLNEEIRAIGGSYSYLRAVVLPLSGRGLLYLVGAALVDTSCCGVGGCGFALVAGWIADEEGRGADPRHSEASPWSPAPQGDPQGGGGQPAIGVTNRGDNVLMVVPITDPEQRRVLARLIQEEEMVQEVRFWSPEEVIP